MRLYGGYSRAAGAAEVCINGLWGNICYRNWDETDSSIFCRDLLGREKIGMDNNVIVYLNTQLGGGLL